MPQKKMDYGNGLRGCFLTIIKWPVQMIGSGIVWGSLYMLLRFHLPQGKPLYHAIASWLAAWILIRMTVYVVTTFLRFATAEKQTGIVALDRDLRGGGSERHR